MTKPKLTPLQNLLYNRKILEQQSSHSFSVVVNGFALIIIVLLLITLIYRYSQNIENKKKALRNRRNV